MSNGEFVSCRTAASALPTGFDLDDAPVCELRGFANKRTTSFHHLMNKKNQSFDNGKVAAVMKDSETTHNRIIGSSHLSRVNEPFVHLSAICWLV